MKKWLILLLAACLAVPGQAQEKFTRGFAGRNKIFIPKGSVGGGLGISWRKYTLGEDDNLSLVARFEYSWLGVDLDNASLHLSEDLGLDITGEHYKRQSYALAAGVRYYLPFMGSKVFGFFVEGAVNGGYVHSMLYELEDGLKHGTYNSNWKVALRVDPGICFFVQENVDFEVSVGLLDLTYQFNKQSENQVKTSSGSGLGTGFNINLLALRFGVHFYLW